MKDKKYRIRVGEPWDYEHLHGAIRGCVIRIISPVAIVFEADSPREFDGHKGKIFILHTRHYGEIFDFKNKDFIASVGGMLYLGNNHEKDDYPALEKDSVYVLIGSLQEVRW